MNHQIFKMASASLFVVLWIIFIIYSYKPDFFELVSPFGFQNFSIGIIFFILTFALLAIIFEKDEREKQQN